MAKLKMETWQWRRKIIKHHNQNRPKTSDAKQKRQWQGHIIQNGEDKTWTTHDTQKANYDNDTQDKTVILTMTRKTKHWIWQRHAKPLTMTHKTKQSLWQWHAKHNIEFDNDTQNHWQWHTRQNSNFDNDTQNKTLNLTMTRTTIDNDTQDITVTMTMTRKAKH